MRPNDIVKALNSIKAQTLFPDEIIVVDASKNVETKNSIEKVALDNLKYFFVNEEHKGAAKQRNYGIDAVAKEIDIVFFIDDDVVLLPNYCEEIMQTFTNNPTILGVGGYIIDHRKWEKVSENYKPKIEEYVFDSYKTKLSSRNIFRKKLGLFSTEPPGFMPNFSHGHGLFPASGKTYPTELLLGGCCAYKKSALLQQKFDTFFEGYSLYEDAALSLKIANKGSLCINTKAQLYHYHAPSGRPNQYVYGKMVVRNGWYVWRIKNPNPSIKNSLKWHLITLLLTFLRFINIFTTANKKAAFTESLGRFVAWFNLFYNKPKIER